jgi:hypothetical protein
MPSTSIIVQLDGIIFIFVPVRKPPLCHWHNKDAIDETPHYGTHHHESYGKEKPSKHVVPDQARILIHIKDDVESEVNG